ncbi:MAG: HEAT repeat domain-containing protein [Bacteroidales bacterium]|nr:HEAT repeat domain-containing protein [Bacteroidales bacterium]
MLLQTVFLGVFLSIFDISATAMFMDEFGEDMLPKAFLVSGLVGFTLTAAYSKLQAIIPFSRLIILNLLCISLITLFLRLGFDFYSGKILIFLVFIMMGPLNLLGIVGFWGMASRLFTLRQGKRLFGLIDSGQIIGIIVIMLMVPVLLNLLKDTKNLLFISSGSIIVALLIQIIISSKFNLNKSQEKNTRDSSTPVSLIKLFKIRYVRAMAMFVVLSMLAAFFMFYTFLPITKAKYSGEGEYTTFLGVFMASLMFFTLLFKTFAYSKLTKVYGLKLNLILPPAILGICTILAIIVGFLFGYAVESASFMLFFLLISLGRLFSVSLKSGIEVPSQKVLYQSMDVSIRHRVQVAVDGMVNEIAAILSGLVLLIIGLFDFFEPIHYSIFLLIITVIWIFVGLKLHKEYRQSLEVTLDKSRGNEKEKEKERENQFSENIGNYIADNKVEPVMANVMLDFAKELSPLLYTKFCESALLSGKEEISKQLLKRISSEQQFALAESLKKYINQEKNETLKNEATKIHSKLIEKVESNSTSTIIAELVSSAYPADKIMAANILSLNKNPELSKYLIVLLRDIFPEVRIAAIRASSLIKDKEFIPAIVDYLDSDLYHNYAYEALLAYGKEALPQIDQFFYKSGLNHKVQIQIIKLFGITGGKQAIKLLINKLNYYNHNIIIETCHSLNKCGYFAENQEEKAKINMILTDNIRIIAWNLNILVQLRENLNDLDLIRTMEQEIKKNYENIFLILSIAYNPKSVSHVKENLELETAEGISFALELLDLFIDENIKPILMIVFEDISEYERVRRFQDHFPLEKMEPHQILNSLINRDINWISRWSKAISLNAISKLENYSVGIDIVAHLFNNDKLMSELAAGIINQIDSKFYAECLERLDIQKRNSLMKILKNKEPENLLFHNVIFLKKISQFESIDEEILLEIVEEAKEIRLGNGDKIKISGSIKHNDILVIRTGALKIRKKGAMQAEILNNGIIIPLSQIPEIENELEAEELTIIINLPFATVCKYINYYPKISNLVNKIV